MHRITRPIRIIAALSLSAAVPLLGSAQATYPNPLPVNDIPGFFAMILQGLVLLMTPLIIVFIIYAGYLFVTAQGDERKLASAKRALLWTLIGAGVIIGAELMALILQDTLDDLNQ